MSVAVQELISSVNKQVVLHIKSDDGSVAILEGKMEAASEAGFAFKEKGKSNLEVYMPGQVVKLEKAPEKPKALAQKKMKPVELGQARSHLLYNHGVPLDWARSTDEAAALEYHGTLDHENLGHVHVVAEPTARDEALAEDGEPDAA